MNNNTIDTCKGCRYWTENMYCKRYPPAGIAGGGGYPQTEAGCGEYTKSQPALSLAIQPSRLIGEITTAVDSETGKPEGEDLIPLDLEKNHGMKQTPGRKTIEGVQRLAKKAQNDPQLCRELLIKAGILTPKGNLRSKYREAFALIQDTPPRAT